ncbi:hemolysin type calcium-binding protein [Aliiruegeria haliotis]|uniref:Hemolysin type calcium-binding protein n=1 Tax=Aliiruegeria haliotis TaxID=1280846 RepID=A0A2T0RZW4_9RHOB|nr:hypothetical protein [Aliiruegeria haliotis]PRY26714.1 hemolysin type calcium-binding protein [Aliiruegeria haliotis]
MTHTNTLYGGAGSHRLFGIVGNDRLVGGREKDWLDGGKGADKLDGGRGRDVLIGGKGNDILAGGAYRDAFVCDRRSGKDIIRNFDVANDRLVLWLETRVMESDVYETWYAKPWLAPNGLEAIKSSPVVTASQVAKGTLVDWGNAYVLLENIALDAYLASANVVVA